MTKRKFLNALGKILQEKYSLNLGDFPIGNCLKYHKLDPEDAALRVLQDFQKHMEWLRSKK